MAKKALIFVVDACVARSAGTGTKTPVTPSQESYFFLKQLSESNHCVGFDDCLHHEWRTHHSVYAKQFLIRMHGAKRVCQFDRPELLKHVTQMTACFKNQHQPAAEKDRHLIEIALAADGIVVSLEKNCLKKFKQLAQQNESCRCLKAITWFDPTGQTDVTISKFIASPNTDARFKM
jgi:hypothetical protein